VCVPAAVHGRRAVRRSLLPSGGLVVPLDIQSNVDFLRSFGRTDVDRYAPLLDMRRRIIANAWVRTLDIRGPGSTTMTLSADLFRENAAS